MKRSLEKRPLKMSENGSTQQRLVVVEQHFVDFKNIMAAYFNSANLKIAIRNKKTELDRSGEKFSLQSVQEDLAEKTGISFGAIKHWCAGHNAPSDLDKVRDLAIALDVDVDYLLEYDEEDNTDMNNNRAIVCNNHGVQRLQRLTVQSLNGSCAKFLIIKPKHALQQQGRPRTVTRYGGQSVKPNRRDISQYHMVASIVKENIQ